jgi:hypothetical protein
VFLYTRNGNVKVGIQLSGGLERSDDDSCKPVIFRKGNGHDETKARRGLPLSERLRYAADHPEGRRAGLRRPGGLRTRLHGVERHKEGVRTRMAVVNPESYPTPPLREKKVTAGAERYQTPDSVLDGWPKELDPVAEKIYEDFNKKHGTDFKFQLKK